MPRLAPIACASAVLSVSSPDRRGRACPCTAAKSTNAARLPEMVIFDIFVRAPSKLTTATRAHSGLEHSRAGIGIVYSTCYSYSTNTHTYGYTLRGFDDSTSPSTMKDSGRGYGYDKYAIHGDDHTGLYRATAGAVIRNAGRGQHERGNSQDFQTGARQGHTNGAGTRRAAAGTQPMYSEADGDKGRR